MAFGKNLSDWEMHHLKEALPLQHKHDPQDPQQPASKPVAGLCLKFKVSQNTRQTDYQERQCLD